MTAARKSNFASFAKCESALDSIERQNPHFRVCPEWIALRKSNRVRFRDAVVVGNGEQTSP